VDSLGWVDLDKVRFGKHSAIEVVIVCSVDTDGTSDHTPMAYLRGTGRWPPFRLNTKSV